MPNASGLTLIPITIMMYRAQLGRRIHQTYSCQSCLLHIHINPSRYFLAVCVRQKINILQRNLILFSGDWGYFIGGLVWLFNSMEQEQVSLVFDHIRQHASFYHYLRIYHQRHA